MPSCSHNVWLIGWILFFYQDVLVSCNYNLKKLYWFIFSSGKPSHSQEFFFEMDKWLSLKACALSPPTMNLWIHFSILLGFLQETWSLEDELKKEASGTFTCKDPHRGNWVWTLEPRAAQPVEAAPFTGCPQLTLFRGKANERFGNLEEEKILCNIKIFFFFVPPTHTFPPASPPKQIHLQRVLKMTQRSQVRSAIVFLLESVNYEIYIKCLKHF